MLLSMKRVAPALVALVVSNPSLALTKKEYSGRMDWTYMIVGNLDYCAQNLNRAAYRVEGEGLLAAAIDWHDKYNSDRKYGGGEGQN